MKHIWEVSPRDRRAARRSIAGRRGVSPLHRGLNQCAVVSAFHFPDHKYELLSAGVEGWGLLCGHGCGLGNVDLDPLTQMLAAWLRMVQNAKPLCWRCSHALAR